MHSTRPLAASKSLTTEETQFDKRTDTRRWPLARRPVICILALSQVVDDPRARRQGDAFWNTGWHVIGVGLAGGRSPAPRWPICCIDKDHRASRYFQGSGVLGRLNLGRFRAAADLLMGRLGGGLAYGAYWRLFTQAYKIYGAARQFDADIWLANDWTMLPVAHRLAQETGGAFGYDTHELATEEFAGQFRWRLWKRPLVRAIEGRFIGDTAVISAVSRGIAERLQCLYSLPATPIIIRNTPPYERISFRPTAAAIHVIYHGIIAPGRGLEALIDSVSYWRSEFDLTIRGPGHDRFRYDLQNRISRRGLQNRIRLTPPVPMTVLVQEAAAFDVGIFVLPMTSRHDEFALPNKFFEYIMAGLAICVSDLPEMAQLTRQYDLGVTIPRIDPAVIAATINRLSPSQIDGYKRNALATAHELCWERECVQLVSAYDALVHRADR
jgi:glycosyltransferase involved in cell wall biosynthesis